MTGQPPRAELGAPDEALKWRFFEVVAENIGKYVMDNADVRLWIDEFGVAAIVIEEVVEAPNGSYIYQTEYGLTDTNELLKSTGSLTIKELSIAHDVSADEDLEVQVEMALTHKTEDEVITDRVESLLNGENGEYFRDMINKRANEIDEEARLGLNSPSAVEIAELLERIDMILPKKDN